MDFERVRQNKIAQKMFNIMVMAIIVINIIAAVFARDTWGHVIIYDVILALTMVVVFLMSNSRKDAIAIRYVMMIGFCVFYLCVNMFSPIATIFACVLPALVITIVFNDLKFTIIYTVVADIINILAVVYKLGFVKDGTMMAETAVMGIVFLCMTGLFCCMSTKFISEINAEKMGIVKREEERQQQKSEMLMEIGQQMSQDIDESVVKMNSLRESIVETQNNMAQISSGIGDTSEAVQEQLGMTGDIQNQINFVADTADAISKNVDNSAAIIEDSMKIMNTMLKDVEASDIAGQDVKNSLGQLQENTNSMKQIVSLINDVAEQTSLLALNASIEAARAGEAGRGFAVVAGEVNNLSIQTQSATTDISALIDDIAGQVQSVVEKTGLLLDNNARQSVSAEATNDKLIEVQNCSRDIDSNSDKLSSAVKALQDANSMIVNNISNISAVSQEVAAQASASYSEAAKNLVVVDDMMGIVNRLNESADTINNF